MCAYVCICPKMVSFIKNKKTKTKNKQTKKRIGSGHARLCTLLIDVDSRLDEIASFLISRFLFSVSHFFFPCSYF